MRYDKHEAGVVFPYLDTCNESYYKLYIWMLLSALKSIYECYLRCCTYIQICVYTMALRYILVVICCQQRDEDGFLIHSMFLRSSARIYRLSDFSLIQNVAVKHTRPNRSDGTKDPMIAVW